MDKYILDKIQKIQHGLTPNCYKRAPFGVFPCDWIEVQFGEIAFLSKRQYSRSETDDNPICIELEHLGEGYRNGNSYGQEQSSNKNCFEIGDVLFGKLRPYLKKYYLAKENGVCSTEIWVIKSRNVNNLFLYFIIGSDRFITVADESAFGTKMPRAEWKTVIKSRFPIPANQSEQARIAKILMKWDEAIELYEQLIEKYKQRKAIFLQKMFPSKGKDVPEWRFKGFTTPWEQRKLGDLLQTISFKAYLKEPEQDGKYEIIQQGNEPIIGYANGLPCDDYQNTVIFGDHTLSLYKPQSPFFVATDGVRIIKGVEDMDGYFLLELLERNKPQSEGYKRYFSILADRDAYFTPDHDEQTQIGAYFGRLDNLITLHQRKLDSLKKQRKALQQYLLTGIARVKI